MKKHLSIRCAWPALCLAVAASIIPGVQIAHAQFMQKLELGDGGLIGAATRGDVAAIARHLAKGADPNASDENKRTPLHHAAQKRQGAAMRALVAGGADPNAFDAAGWDIVTQAVFGNDIATLKLALELGCSAKNTNPRWGGTALIPAARMGRVEMVRVLIGAGAPLDQVDPHGTTAAIAALLDSDIWPRRAATLKALIDAGANPNLADRAGQTPLSLARARGDLVTVKMLQDAGAQ